uniref:Uncharacterized protein n=1 Tax=Caenorhabditis tropicalis TaxID=1561998 RepID=A0A1I7UFS7_9PELO
MQMKNCPQQQCDVRRRPKTRICIYCVHMRGSAMGMDIAKKRTVRRPMEAKTKKQLHQDVRKAQQKPDESVKATAIPLAATKSKKRAIINLENVGDEETTAWL